MSISLQHEDIPSEESIMKGPSENTHNFFEFSETNRSRIINQLYLNIDKPGTLLNLPSPKINLPLGNALNHEKSFDTTNKFPRSPINGKIRNSDRFSQLSAGAAVNKSKISTNVIRMLGKLIRLIRKVRWRLEFSKIERLNQLQVTIINDYAYDEELVLNKKSGKRLNSMKATKNNFLIYIFWAIFSRVNIVKRLLFTWCKISDVPIFAPTGKFILVWNLFLLIFIFVQTYIISIQLFFDHSVGIGSGSWKSLDFFGYFEFMGIFLFAMDILFHFNTGFYQSGDIIFERKVISRRYMRGAFMLDFLSLIALICPAIYFSGIPFDDSSLSEIRNGLTFSKFYWVKFMFFLKINEMRTIFKNLEEILFNEEKYENILSLVKLFLEMIVVSHLIACLWNLVGELSTESYRNNWYSSVAELNTRTSWNVKYIYSLYWSFSTMLTVGYGDVSAKNPSETCFSMGAIMFGCMFFAYAINSIGNLVEENNRKLKVLRSELRTINKLMKRSNCELNLRIRVRKYLEHLFYEEGTREAEKESSILNKLSHSLKHQVLTQMHGRVFDSFDVFYKNFSPDALERAAQVMKTVRFAPGDDIFIEEEENNGEIYFLLEGEVELYMNCIRRNNEYVKLKTVKALDYFSMEAFFSGLDRKFSARSLTFTTILLLNRDDFLSSVTKSSKEDKEAFHMIKDNIVLYDVRPDAHRKCESCSETTHHIKNCPLLQFKPNRDMLIRKYLYSAPHKERTPFKRKKKVKSVHPWLMIKQLIEITEKTYKTKMKKNNFDNESTSQNTSQSLISEDEEGEDYKGTIFENTEDLEPKNKHESWEDLTKRDEPSNRREEPVLLDHLQSLKEENKLFTSVDRIQNKKDRTLNKDEKPRREDFVFRREDSLAKKEEPLSALKGKRLLNLKIDHISDQDSNTGRKVPSKREVRLEHTQDQQDQGQNKFLRKAISKMDQLGDMDSNALKRGVTKRDFRGDDQSVGSSVRFKKANSSSNRRTSTSESGVDIKELKNDGQSKEGELFIPDLDKICNFPIYFPYNNADHVTQYFSSLIKKNKKKKTKRKLTEKSKEISNINVGALIDHKKQLKFFHQKRESAIVKSPMKKKRIIAGSPPKQI